VLGLHPQHLNFAGRKTLPANNKKYLKILIII